MSLGFCAVSQSCNSSKVSTDERTVVGISTVSIFMVAAYHFFRLKVSVLFGASGHGLSPEKLAELMEVNPRTIQKIEAGKLNIPLTTILRLQTALDCSWDSLMRR